MRGFVHIKIGGEDRPFLFGVNASAVLCDLHNIDLAECGKIINKPTHGRNLIDIMYAGLVTGAHVQKQTPDFDQWDVGVWLGDFQDSEMQKAMKAIKESMSPAKKKGKSFLSLMTGTREKK